MRILMTATITALTLTMTSSTNAPLGVASLDPLATGRGEVARGGVRDVVPSRDTYQGQPAEWWARKTTHWKRAANKRGRTIRTLQRNTRRRWEPTLLQGIELAAIAYGQSSAALRRVAYCESKFFLYARSPGGHLGPFQFHPSTWARTPYGRFSPFDPTAAPLAAAWMWAHNRKAEWSCR